MTFNEYQEFTKSTAIYSADVAEWYLVAGLSAEAGEIASKYAKSWRDGAKVDVDEVAKELGDVLWFVSQLADYTGYSLLDIALKNKAKLSSRKERGVIKGSGDNR